MLLFNTIVVLLQLFSGTSNAAFSPCNSNIQEPSNTMVFSFQYAQVFDFFEGPLAKSYHTKKESKDSPSVQDYEQKSLNETRLTSNYSSYARTINQGLQTSDLIYPFHYFF